MKVIFLNGPPRAGKDTIGHGLVSYLNNDDDRFSAEIFKFAKALKDCVHVGLGLSGVPTDHFENVKDTPLKELNWQTPRQCYIRMSENWLKPEFGREVFGNSLRNTIRLAEDRCDVAVVTDSGFGYEAEPIINHYGPENCFLIRVKRQGCDFSGDSRSFIELPQIEQYELLNNGTIEEAVEAAIQRVYFWMENNG